jgi:hypothetical protein
VHNDAVAVAVDFGAWLDAAGVRWVTGGSIASSVHGEARATRDADLVVNLEPARVRTLAAMLARDYYADEDDMREAVKSASSFNAVHYASAIKIDCFIAGDDPFEAERLAARIRTETPTGVLYVDTAEHTVLRKLEWYRRGNETSDHQWRDVQAIVRIQGDRLDRGRLKRWGLHLRVTDLLDRVLSPRA